MGIEDRIREAIERRVAGARASEEAWDFITRRMGRSRRRSTVNRLLVVTTALLVSAGSLLGLWAAFRPAGRPGPMAGGTTTASPTASETQATPSPSGEASAQAPVDFGWGRLPFAPAICPGGSFEPSGNADRAIPNITEVLLQAANGRSPDPAKVWAIMDDSFKGLFASYEDFAARFEQVSVDPEWTVWDIHAVRPRPGVPFDARGWIRENCGEEVAAALTGAMWEIDVFWPNAEGLSAGVVHLYYVGRVDGPRLWLVY
jgi:hypothetical protein